MSASIAAITLTFYWLFQSACTANKATQYISTCDSSNVTYGKTVTEILNTSCNGCHSTAAATAGVILDNYTEVKKYVTSGSLVGSIAHDPAFKPMPYPQGSAKLDDCKIALIKKWVANGAPNN